MVSRSRRNRKVKKHNLTHKLKRVHTRQTNYARRLRLLRGEMPFLTLRRSNRQFSILAFLDHQRPDLQALSMSSCHLRQAGYQGSMSNRAGAYLLGRMFAHRMKKQGHTEELLINIGNDHATPRGRFYAMIKGLYEGGLSIRTSEKNFPSDELIAGIDGKNKQRIEEFLKTLTSEGSSNEESNKEKIADE